MGGGAVFGLMRDVFTAAHDPRNLGKDAVVIQDVISIAVPAPYSGLINTGISAYVVWVKLSGGGTISIEYYPIRNGQTSPTHHRGRVG